MSYARTSRVLIIPGVTPVSLPARFRTLGGGRGDGTIYNSNASHTATVPRHEGLVEDNLVNDGTYDYRIIEIQEIQGKYRLRLERI